MRQSDTFRRLRFYVGLGLVTAATLMLQIVETRLVSVTSWYHLAFFIISTAMFGLTAGAVRVYLRSAAFTPDRLFHHLTAATLGFALTTILALIAQMTLATTTSASLMGLLVWAEFAICLAVPFFFSGVVVSLALTRSPWPVGEVYGVDLIGAALGCLGVLALLNLVDGPSAVLWIAVVIAAAALLFAGAEPGRGAGPASADVLIRHRSAIFVGALVLAIGNGLTGYGIRPMVVKDRFEAPGQFAVDRWNSFSRITVTGSSEGPPMLWGPSPRTPAARIGQRWMTIDGAAGTSMYRFGGDLQELSFLRYDITNLAYAIPGLERGAVIGVGGGRDVLSARLFGVGQVVGVEINPIFIDLLTRRFADYNAVARLSGVAFAVDEARSWFARAGRSFDIIQMSLIDTWAATGAGAFTLSENGLYTIEGWRIFLERLEPDGVFTVSRWYAPGEVNETGRLVSLAVGTLLDLGIDEPRRHLFLASTGNIATLVLAKSAFSEAQLAALQNAAAEHDFTVLLSPATKAASAILERIVSASGRSALEAATQNFYLDLTPPTDDRPFFFNQLRFSRLLDRETILQPWRPGVFGGNLIATLTLAMLIVVSAALVIATIIIPLRPTVRHVGWTLATAGTIYFALIGVGFMMAEIALLQRMSVFLGHPVYALSVVLFSLILSTGLGSLFSERLRLETPARLAVWAVLTAGYLFTLPFWLPGLLLEADGSGILVRAGLCVLVLAPAGFLMGFGFPTGMRLTKAIDEQPTPWFWGVNGAFGVLAASLAVFTSIAFAIDTTLRIGAVCYLLLPVPALFLMLEGRRASQFAPAV